MAYLWEWYDREIIYAIAVSIVSIIIIVMMHKSKEQ